jgi:hypothetical protein
MELRKLTTWTPTRLTGAEGYMNKGDSASPYSVRRSRRPQTRLEASCTRTGRPRRHLRPKSGRRSAGEGVGRTARMYISEESDSGIVPMNHSNNDGTSPAESEEGRLLIKDNILPTSTYPTQSGSARVPRVGECADKCLRLAVIDPR